MSTMICKNTSLLTPEQENTRNALRAALKRERENASRQWSIEYSYPDTPNIWLAILSSQYSDKEIKPALKRMKNLHKRSIFNFRAVKRVQITYTRTYIKG
jgi:hypothetical protein